MPGISDTRREIHFGDRLMRCFVERGSNTYAELQKAATRTPSAEAIVFEGHRFSYADLMAEIGIVARMLADGGVRSGDRVALFVGNRPGFAIAAFATLRLGAVVVPIDIRLAPPEIEHAILNCAVSALLIDDTLADRLPACLPPSCQHFVLPPGRNETRSTLRDDGTSVGSPRLNGYLQAGEEDAAFILHTSGTSGRPKGVVLSHINVLHSVRHFQILTGVNSADRIGVVTPVTHVTGLIMGLVSALLTGATAIILREFRARAFLELAETECVTQTVMVPAMYRLCLMDPEFARFDLAQWRIGNYGGSPMPEATTRELAARLPRLQLINGYGSTETCSPAVMVVPGGELVHGDCVGWPLPCADVVLMDESGREVPTGSPGEIWIAGPMVSKGYWNDVEATRAGFSNGYWRSGDIGRFDEKGRLHLLDRIKDMVNRGGYKIFSAEVENVISSLRGVVEVAVVGKPSEVLGERVHAFVAVSDAAIDPETLKAFCASRLADFKVPESFTITTERLPRGPGGKVSKRELRDRAALLGNA